MTGCGPAKVPGDPERWLPGSAIRSDPFKNYRPMKWFLKCIRHYATFSGRARRKEYWYFILFSIVTLIVAMALDTLCFGYPYKLFCLLAALFLFLPQLAVMARRLHDIGRRARIVGWYYVAVFVWTVSLMVGGLDVFVGVTSGSGRVPVGFLVLLGGGSVVFLAWSLLFLVWFCRPGMRGENAYGPDPKEGEEPEE